MNIQALSTVFTCKIIPKTQTAPKRSFLNKLFGRDTFVRTTFDIKNDLKNIELREKINEGRRQEVYTTNFDGIVVGLAHGVKFKPKKLKEFNDPNGLILAKDESGFTCIMKHIKGEPLYCKKWKIMCPMPKNEYLQEFNKIQNLPDKTFAEYMRDVITIRKNGYNTDPVNPNNFLLDDKHIGIVDLEISSQIKPELTFNDLDPLVNTYHLRKIIKMMPKKEIYQLACIIKSFCDRMTSIAKKEGYSLNIPNYKTDGYPKDSHLISYLYYQNWDIIKNIIKNEVSLTKELEHVP